MAGSLSGVVSVGELSSASAASAGAATSPRAAAGTSAWALGAAGVAAASSVVPALVRGCVSVWRDAANTASDAASFSPGATRVPWAFGCWEVAAVGWSPRSCLLWAADLVNARIVPAPSAAAPAVSAQPTLSSAMDW